MLSKKISDETKGTLAILLATVFWGMTFAFIKDAVTVITPYNFIFWRFGLAGTLLFLVFFKKIKFKQPRLIFQGVLLGLFLGSTIIFQTIGLQYTSAATASFITGLSVILVPVFLSVIKKSWPKKNVLIAVMLAMSGVALITLSGGLSLNKGDLWVLLCAISFAIGIILTGKFSKVENTITLTWFQLATIFVMVMILNISSGGIRVPTDIHVWIDIGFCAIFASVIALGLQMHFQSQVSPNKTAIIFAAEPIFATITAAIYLDEKLTIIFVIGAILIFSGMLISEKRIKPNIIPQD